MINDNITSVRDSLAALATQLCQCCADMSQTVNAGFANAETAANARQMANMQQLFGLQSTMQTGFNGTTAGLADLKYTVATENCADRAAVSDGIRDVLAATQAQTQAILDKMCQDKIDAKNDEIGRLRQEIAMKDLGER